MSDAIRRSILEFGSFSAEELSLFDDMLKTTRLPKNSFLLKEGQICQSFYFLNSGSVRHYYTTDDNSEVTVNLFIEADWFSDYQSFTLQKPSKNNLQTFEESELYELTIHDFHRLIGLSSSFFRLGKILGLTSQNKNTDKVTPEERYINLLDHKPYIVQRFPLKYIASYLGITPETLSRIRRKISQ